MLRIAEQDDPQLFFGDKVAMTFGGVGTDADSHCIHFLKFVYQTGKPLGLFCSTRGIILRIEKKNQPFSPKISQTDNCIILIR